MEPEEHIAPFFCLPSEVGEALTPVQDTLRILTISGPATSPSDRSRLNLSAFTRLEKVNVISNFFLADDAREGLYKLLPQSLLDLRVRSPVPP